MEDRNLTTFSDSGWETSACCTPCISICNPVLEGREVGGTFSFKIVSYEKTDLYTHSSSGSALSTVYLSSLFLRWEGAVRDS